MSPESLEPGPSEVFSDAHTVANLKTLVVRGGAVKLGSQALRLVLRIGGLFIMARLLTPQDFGVFAMMVTITGFLEMFNSTNLMLPTVQKDRITHQQISVLFWVSAALGVLLTLVTAASGPVIAWFYGDPRLVRVALAIAPVFLLRGVAVQHKALLQRRLRLFAIETTHVVSQTLGAIAMIGSAWRGAGYWSLVLNVLVMSASDTVFFWALSGWRPGLPRRGTGARQLLVFGGSLSAYEMFLYLQGSLDQMLIGRSWGARAVGFYAKASGLIALSFTQLTVPIGYVVIPALSRLQSERERYRVYYSKAVGATLFLTMSMVAFISIDAKEVVLTALGGQWLAVVPIFLALAPAAAAATLAVMYTWACLSLGHGRRLSRASFWTTAGSTAAFLAGLRWGPIGVARAYSAAYCLMIVPIIAYGLGESPISLSDVWRIAWRPASAATAAALLALAVRPFGFHSSHAALQMTADAAVFGLAYLGVWAVIPGGRDFLLELSTSGLRAFK